MKKTFKLFAIALIAVIGFSFAACGDEDEKDTPDTSVFSVTGSEEFNSAIEGILSKPGSYVINLSGDIIDFPGIVLNKEDVTITLKGTGTNKIVWKPIETGPGSIFGISGAKLILENIELKLIETEHDYNSALIYIEKNGILEIKNGVTISDNIGKTNTIVWISDGGSCIMSGGTIKNCYYGIGMSGSGNSVTISGGEIENIIGSSGILFWNANNSTLTINGGYIKNNKSGGIGAWGDKENKNNSITITGGTIMNNNDSGINITGNENIVNITGGEISGNDEHGIAMWDDCELNISGGVIKNNKDNGIIMWCENGKLTISGGVIKGNEKYGIVVEAKSSEFKKEEGSVIYGKNADVNSNKEGAINIANTLHIYGDAGEDVELSAKTNAAGDGIESSTGTWDQN